MIKNVYLDTVQTGFWQSEESGDLMYLVNSLKAKSHSPCTGTTLIESFILVRFWPINLNFLISWFFHSFFFSDLSLSKQSRRFTSYTDTKRYYCIHLMSHANMPLGNNTGGKSPANYCTVTLMWTHWNVRWALDHSHHSYLQADIYSKTTESTCSNNCVINCRIGRVNSSTKFLFYFISSTTFSSRDWSLLY